MLPDGPLVFIRGEGGVRLYLHTGIGGVEGEKGRRQYVSSLSLSFSSLLYTPVNRRGKRKTVRKNSLDGLLALLPFRGETLFRKLKKLVPNKMCEKVIIPICVITCMTS